MAAIAHTRSRPIDIMTEFHQPHSLSYQQIRLLELVDGSGREQQNYLVAPVEQGDAQRCVELGYLEMDGQVAKLTEAGHLYIIALNSAQ